METRATKIHSAVNKNAIIRVIPGHFVTNQPASDDVHCHPGDKPRRTADIPRQYADDDTGKALLAAAGFRDNGAHHSPCS